MALLVQHLEAEEPEGKEIAQTEINHTEMAAKAPTVDITGMVKRASPARPSSHTLGSR